MGMNFYEGVEVVFGTLSASAEVGSVPGTCWYSVGRKHVLDLVLS